MKQPRLYERTIGGKQVRMSQEDYKEWVMALLYEGKRCGGTYNDLAEKVWSMTPEERRRLVMLRILSKGA